MWSRISNNRLRPARALAGLCAALALLGGCGSSGPKRPVLHPAGPVKQHPEPTPPATAEPAPPAPVAAPAPTSQGAPAPGAGSPAASAPKAPPPAPAAAAPAPAPAAGSAAPAAAAAAPIAAPPAVVHPPVSPAARADFDRVVNYMRGGNTVEAELGFKRLSLQYPQYAAPLVNLAILQRKDGHLDQAEETLRSAVGHEPGSALAWTELGATQRQRGEFKEAAASYQQAISADPRYAPAWRNLGVVSDLYLEDPNRALAAFEQYRQLTGEDKPVSGWIAELRQRLGMPPVKRPAPAAPEAPGEAAPPPGEPPPAEPATKPGPGAEPPSQPAPGSSLAGPQGAAGTPPEGG